MEEDAPLLPGSRKAADVTSSIHAPPALGPGVGIAGTMVNLFKCTVGAGILSFPYGFASAGWLGGLLASVFVTMPVIVGLRLLLKVRTAIIFERLRKQRAGAPVSRVRPNYHGKDTADPDLLDADDYARLKRKAENSREYLEFHDMAQAALGPGARRFVIGLICVGQIGCCIAYVIFIANNLHAVQKPATDNAVLLPRFAFALMALPFVTGLSLIPRVKSLTKFAVVGSLLSLAGMTMILLHGASMLAAGKIVGGGTIPPMFGSARGVILFCGMVFFAVESVAQVPALQASMEEPKRFSWVLTAVSCSLIILYVVVGLGGAYLYGKDTNSVITRNMGTSATGMACRVVFVIMLLLTFPFALWPAATILQRLRGPDAEDPENMTFAARATRVLTNFYVVRVGLCVLITALGMFFTDFGTFLALVGYPFFGLQGMLLPAAMYLSMDRRIHGGRLSAAERGQRKFDRCVSWALLVLGGAFVLVGTIISVIQVVEGDAEGVR